MRGTYVKNTKITLCPVMAQMMTAWASTTQNDNQGYGGWDATNVQFVDTTYMWLANYKDGDGNRVLYLNSFGVQNPFQ